MRIVFHIDSQPPPSDIVKMNPLPIEKRIIQRPAPADERKRVIYHFSSTNERRKRISIRSARMAKKPTIQRLSSIDENKICEWQHTPFGDHILRSAFSLVESNFKYSIFSGNIKIS